MNPIAMLDSLAVSDLPAEHKAEMPRVSDQLDKLNELNGLYQLEQLHQVTDLAAPAMGLVGAVE